MLRGQQVSLGQLGDSVLVDVLSHHRYKSQLFTLCAAEIKSTKDTISNLAA